MRDLLDSSSSRRLMFIECMLKENQWWKTEKIAAQLKCSESTVKSDMNYFRLYFSSTFKFETSKQKGVRLNILHEFQMDNFYQQILRECLNVQFVNLLFYDSLQTLEEYAEELYTSVSSVKRCIELVKPVLKKYGLTIQQKPIRIQGQEKQIIFFYGVLFWEEYGTSCLKRHSRCNKEAYTLVKAFKTENKLALSATLMNKMTLWLVLIFERLSKANHIESNYTPLLPVSKETEQLVSRELEKLPFKIHEEDSQFISYFLESRYIFFTRDTIEQNQRFLQVYDDIEVFLTILTERMSIFLGNKEMVHKRLFSHYLYKIEFQGLSYSLVERNKITVYNQGGLYDDFLETAVDVLENFYRGEWLENVLDDPMDFLYILISTWENLTTEILKHRNKINVLIVSQFGLYHEKFLEELMQLYYPYKLKSFLSANEDYPDSIQLIVTDHEVTEYKFRLDNSIPVVGINYSANEHSWDQIKMMIDQIYSHQKDFRPEKEIPTENREMKNEPGRS